MDDARMLAGACVVGQPKVRQAASLAHPKQIGGVLVRTALQVRPPAPEPVAPGNRASLLSSLRHSPRKNSPRMTSAEAKVLIPRFIDFAKTLDGDEKTNEQLFLDRLFKALGHAGANHV